MTAQKKQGVRTQASRPGKKTAGAKTPAPENHPGSVSAPAFPVVGIGASAGGLEAFERFFSAMPDEFHPGMAFVLVQHLAPEHKSLLAGMIRRYTTMPVFEVADGMVVEPGCVYIIPPNRDMAFFNGTLQLLEPVLPRGRHLAIDFFSAPWPRNSMSGPSVSSCPEPAVMGLWECGQ